MRLFGMKVFAVRLLLVAAGIMLGLLLVEVLLRVVGYDHPGWQLVNGKNIPTAGFPSAKEYTYDPITGYSLVPNINDGDRGITTDRNGFRITSRSFDRGKKSVIFVGDSTVFGYLSPDKESYPYVLSQAPELATYNVINMGVPGYSLAHITQVLKRKVPEFNPKVVVVGILWPWKPFEGYQSSPNAWKDIDWHFYKMSFMVRTRFENTPDSRLATVIFLQDMWRKARYGKQIQENFARPTEIYDFQVSQEFERELAWEHVRALREASKPLQELGVKVLFYIHPFQYTLFREEYKNLGTIGRQVLIDELGAAYVGDCIRDNFAKRPAEPLFVDSEHMTRAGNIVLAACVGDVLKEHLAR